MSLAAPLFLPLGLAVALGVVALHFLSRREPRPEALPTARFVAARAARAPAFARRPTDLVVLGLRVAAVMLVAVGFARPTLHHRRPLARIVVVDPTTDDSLTATADTVIRAPSLSAGLVAAVRQATRLAPEVDSLELVIVSPLAREAVDAATLGIRATWPGRARLVRAAPRAAGPGGVSLVAAPDDPLAATVALAGLRHDPVGVRVTREPPAAADSAWAWDGGGALVHWPTSPAQTGWRTADSAGSVTAKGVTVVSRFPRASPPGDGAVAWWEDGAVAATERPFGRGCRRDVGIDLSAGDVALRAGTRDLVQVLLAPCGPRRDERPLGDSTLAALRRDGPLLSGRALPPPAPARVPANPWLLVAAALVLVAEHGVRRGPRGDAP